MMEEMKGYPTPEVSWAWMAIVTIGGETFEYGLHYPLADSQDADAVVSTCVQNGIGHTINLLGWDKPLTAKGKRYVGRATIAFDDADETVKDYDPDTICVVDVTVNQVNYRPESELI